MFTIPAKQENENKVFDLFIESTDVVGMDTAYRSLPHELRRSMVGSGFDFSSGKRDYHFRIRGHRRANHVIICFKRLIRKRKRGGFSATHFATAKL